MSKGRLVLPEFQRDFVWEPNNVVELLDSVAHGWPIGSLLVLEGPQPFKVKAIDGGPTELGSRADFYLLDGQQRITSLYHAFTGTGDTVYFVDTNAAATDELSGEMLDDVQIRWATEEQFERRERRPGVFVLADLLDDARYHQITQAMSSAELRRLNGIRRELLGSLVTGDYIIPATVMSSGIELEALTRIFETLNRTGVQLDAFDLMVAVLYPHDFYLVDEWQSAKEACPELEHFEVSGLEVLKVVALWQREGDRLDPSRPRSRRVLGVRQRDVLNIAPEFVIANWNRAVKAYAAALRMAYGSLGIRDGGSIPSAGMVLTMAFLIDFGVDDVAIIKWYWRTIVHQDYAQGANTRVVTDVDVRGAVLPDEESDWRRIFTASMQGSARRNKILRLGIRGLIISRGGLDPLGEKGLLESEPPFRDIPMDTLLSADRVAPVADTMIIDLLTAPEESVRVARRDFRRGVRAEDIVQTDALTSQGFDSELVVDISERREARLRTLISWVGEWA